MATKYPINPRVRAYGKARLDIAQRARTSADWQRLWLPPVQDFPFEWGEPWKQCVEYKVDDFAAEVGFYVDVLGLSVIALDPDYAMFTSPGGDFYFAVVPALSGGESTPPEAIRLQFMIADILATAEVLEDRGINFEAPPAPCQEGSQLYIGYFRSPHGIPIDLWGMVGNEDEGQVRIDLDAPVDVEEIEDEVDVGDSTSPTITEAEDEFQGAIAIEKLEEPVEEKENIIKDESPDFDYVYEDLAE